MIPRPYLTTETIKFEEILDDMELSSLKAKKQKETADKLLSEAQRERERIEKESKALEDKKHEILQKAKKEARDLLLDAEAEANDIIKELTNLRKNKEKNVNKVAEEARGKLKQSISEMQKDLTKPKVAVTNALTVNEVKVGMTVYVPSIDNEATIVSLPDKKEKVMVQSGIIKLAVHISNLEKIPEKKNEVNVKINNMIKSKS